MVSKLEIRGFTLIEVLVATTLLVLVFVALASLLTKSLSLSQQARDRAKANEILQGTIENIRSHRDQSTRWSDFIDTASCQLRQAVPTPSDLRFQPTIQPSGVNCAEKVKVAVTVCWEDKSVAANTYFTKWDK